MEAVITSPVLVLNRSFLPLRLTTLKRAFCMLYTGLAKAVDEEYRTFDFESWSQLSAAVHDETVGLVDRLVRVPRVVVLTAYDRIPKRSIRFSRLNILIRDQYICQYCNQRFPRSQLNLDHVRPRTLGGETVWENIVACCLECNHKKGGQSPHEAGLKLVRQPFRPKVLPIFDGFRNLHYEQWKPFLNIVDYSYWNVELEK